MDEVTTAWLAGLLEGEGCFQMEKHRSSSGASKPMLQLKMTDEDVVARVAALWGVSVIALPPGAPGHQPQFRARLRGARAAEMMAALHPHLGRRRQAAIDSILGAKTGTP